MRLRQASGGFIVCGGEIAQRRIAQRTPARRLGIGVEIAGIAHLLIKLRQARAMGAGDGAHQPGAGGMNAVGIHRHTPRRQFAFGRRHQHLRGEGGGLFRLRQHVADGPDVGHVGISARFAGHFQHDFGGQDLPGFPAIEIVAVLAHQGGAVVAAMRGAENHRRGKAPSQRQQRFFVHINKREALKWLGQFQHPRLRAAGILAVQGQRQMCAALAHQADPYRHMHGFFVALSRRRGQALGQIQRVGPRLGVICAFGLDHGRARLAIPETKLRQVAATGILKTFDPVFHRGGLAIMADEIQIGGLAITVIAHQRLQHTDNLGAFFVDGCGVEIIDLDIALRLHRMGEGPGIFLELPSAQRPHILDALHAMAAHVAGKTLVAENRQALFQGQLEPVAAGDAVAGPVVEIFMRHHAFDAGIIIVGGGLRRGQQHLVVEDVEAFVFHRPHVEGTHRHDHEDVQVVFPAIGLFVPLHRPLEGAHGIGGA